MTGPPLLYRLGECAELLGVSRATVYRMAADGELPTVTIRGKLRVPRLALEHWIADMSEPASAAPAPVRLHG